MRKRDSAFERETKAYAKFLFQKTFGYGWNFRTSIKRHQGKKYIVVNTREGTRLIYRILKSSLVEVHDRDLEYAIIPGERERRERLSKGIDLKTPFPDIPLKIGTVGSRLNKLSDAKIIAKTLDDAFKSSKAVNRSRTLTV